MFYGRHQIRVQNLVHGVASPAGLFRAGDTVIAALEDVASAYMFLSLLMSRSVHASLQTFSLHIPSFMRRCTRPVHTYRRQCHHPPRRDFFCNGARIYECDAEGGALTAKTHVRNRGDSRDRDRQRRRGVQRSFSRDMPGLNPPRDTAPFFAGACLRIPPRLNPSALVFWAWTVRGMLRKPSRQSTPRGDGPRLPWTAGGFPLLSIAPAMPTSTWLHTAMSRCANQTPAPLRHPQARRTRQTTSKTFQKHRIVPGYRRSG